MTELSRSRLEPLWEDGEFILSRSVRDTDGSPILVETALSEPPAPGTLQRLEHAHALRDELEPAWAARPLQLVRRLGRSTLLLEDPGGELLARLLGQPWEVGPFLRVALGLAVALERLHARGFIHKDIKPANILVDVATGEVWLTGFGIASRVRRERQAPAPPPDMIAGTLAYMAPEQTGRMNRSVDSRSDLYAYGVSLYQMLAGALPFTASEPLEWIHCHIARLPTPLGERASGIPEPIAAIVMKLLAKAAEDRYQTAAGVEADLRRCRVEWESQGRIEPFPLGTQDVPDRLLIPEKLYGRERELDTLVAAFERVLSSGRPELVLVSGYSGVGKSSIVNELHKVLVPSRGLFASGKFDQYKRDIPYATLAPAFQSLLRPLLTTSEAELSMWRDALRDAVGPNGRLILDLVPELSLIIGEQPPVPKLPPQDAQRRFQLVFRRFLRVFAQQEHPLLLFLDDLQWLDGATLDLLEDLLTQPDVQHLMLIGAYRENEVTSAHPLMRKLERVRLDGATVQEIVLAPLACQDLGRLIADSLHCEAEHAAPLARLVHEKTAGNPFFAIQFISALAEQNLLTFDHGGGRWSWDLNRIRAKGYTDNVVELMVGKLNRLPVQAQKALEEFACLGNRAEIAVLSIVHGTSEEEVHSDLSEAVRLEFVVRLEGSYEFLHDRVQEAAYSLIPEDLRAKTHLRIGRLLAAHTPPEKREEAIFEIVNQLNRGAMLLTSRDEREELAELDLIAAKRAKASAASASALKYLVAGTTLLANDSWERRHDLTFALELHRAECEFLTGASTEADQRLAELSNRAETTVERAAVACLRTDVYTTLGQTDHAVAVCLDYLRYAGIDWAPHPTDEETRHEYDHIWKTLGSRTIEALIDLPLMDDPASLATMDVLTKLLPPAAYTDASLACMTICRAVTLSLERGNCDASCFAYSNFSRMTRTRFGDHEAGYRIGELGYELVERGGLKRFEASTYLCFGLFVLPWTKHVQACRDLLQRALEIENRNGDPMWASYTSCELNSCRLFAGDPLPELQREAEHGFAVAETAGFGLCMDGTTTVLALSRTLRGLTPTFGHFDDAQHDELEFEYHISNEPHLTLVACRHWVRKLQARYLAGDYPAALDALSRAQQLLWSSTSFFEEAEYYFYGALLRAALHDAVAAEGDGRTSVPSVEATQHLDALATDYRQLRIWAEHCPENFENRAALVGAEIARIEGREREAARLYEQAIRSAQTNGFVHNEALANELASRFYRALGFEKIADGYLRDARYCYLRWGAAGKVRQLEELHVHLGEEPVVPNPAATIEVPTDRLDLSAAVRASQAVSGEIVLENVIERLMVVALEQAGAERGVLILSRGDELRIEAEATTVASRVTVRRRQDHPTTTDLAESILRYVVRTRQSVIVNDAEAEQPFASDPYVRQRRARSILCLPLVKQATLVGVLYLENNLARAVFTPARIESLTLLASQAALSLENARLYSEVQQAERNIRGVLDLVPHHIAAATRDGKRMSGNHVMLDYYGLTTGDAQDSRADELTRRFAHPDDREPFWAEWERGFAGTAPWETEARFRRRDGEYRWFLVRTTPLQDDKGRIVRWYVTATDIDDRKKAEEKVRQDERELRLLFEVVPQQIAMLDPDGRLLQANRTALDFWGFRTPEELQSAFDTDIATLFHSDDLAKLQDTARGALASGLPYEREVRFRRHDGQYRWHLVRYAPLRDEQGFVVRWYGAATDIDDRKRAEERAREETLALREELDKASMFEEIVGASPALQAVLARVAKVAPTDSTVLIGGETGTGKELIARGIHKRSARATRAFVSVNCAAIPPDLIASELFGHEKGAFTGALQRRLGRFELADGGTLFLDEIGELPAETQIAMLRVLQEREFERIGGSRAIAVDVRVIAATNRDLPAAIAAGTFRSDLFYRLNVFPVEMPPLRARQDDIPLLVEYFIHRFARKAGKKIQGISTKTLELLQAYAWPGNIRELQNVIERSVIVCETETFSVDASWLVGASQQMQLASQPMTETLVVQERALIEAALEECRGRVAGTSGAAAKLGMPPSTLESKIRVLKINKHRFKAV